MLAGWTWRDYEQTVILNTILGILASLSFALLVWQWLAARRFPLHQRASDVSFAPAVTLFKPVKGCDAHTENCLRSWFTQEYSGQIQILFGVNSADDAACAIIHKLLGEFPKLDAQLLVCGPLTGANAKVSKLAQLQKLAKHEIFVISDADVRVPPDFLANAVAPLGKDGRDALLRVQADQQVGPTKPGTEVGLVNCFYRLANPSTLAMQWEAIAINADFWSQVLQSKSLKPLDFALGAVMVTRRKNLDEIGGFESLADCLADDYQLGNRIVRKGYHIELCPVVVECWDPPQTFKSVWKHQLRWARTIRVCQPVPYFFSILSNPTLWPLVWFAVVPSGFSAGFLAACFFIRALITKNLVRRFTQKPAGAALPGLAPIKDLLQAAIWLCAFVGHRIEWRGQQFHLRKDGTLVKIKP